MRVGVVILHREIRAIPASRSVGTALTTGVKHLAKETVNIEALGGILLGTSDVSWKAKGPRGASGGREERVQGNKLKEVAGMLNAVSRVTITPPNTSRRSPRPNPGNRPLCSVTC